MNLERFYRDKVVVITGSSRGIGRETARLALAAGARVALNGRDRSSLEACRDALGADRTLAVAADVSTQAGAESLVGTVLKTWGRIDVVINNAGLSMRGAFAELSAATVNAMVSGNLLSAVWTTRAALGALRDSGGRAVFVSSLAAVRGFPGVSLYSAAKMALTAVHQALRAEEPGLRSCLVYLPFTENDPGKTVLDAGGTPFRHERRASTTQPTAARALLTAAARGRPRTILTAAGHLLSWTQTLLPGLVDFMLARSGGSIHSVRRSS
jgi:NAD(P)-dependent dehydrogenase (short-subunit alcohol dehydrogenase family)